MNHIGFTGTQQGITRNQRVLLYRCLKNLFDSDDINVLHHGDCIEGDTEAHDLAVRIGYEIEIHPSTIKSKRAFKNTGKIRKIHEAKPPLERNHDIVNASRLLLACPKEEHEVLRSGTWSTVRYARKKHKRVETILPNEVPQPFKD